jgi:alkylation response protein AidB-like acyl-CoA dehydrogenase
MPAAAAPAMLMTVNDDIATLRSAVTALVPAFRARAGEAERLRTMPADLVIQAKEAGLFRLNLPRSLGGFELEPGATAQIFEEISRADGSAGWTLVIGNSTAFFAWLDPVVAKELIAQQPDFVSTSMWAPLGQATAQPGGFTVSGRWPFNSGCPHATWLQVGVLVTEGGRPRTLGCGAPDWRFAFVPARSAVIEDTWDAMGLCGTGSHHLSLSGVAVPAERLAAPFFEPARHDGPLWRIPLITLAAMFLAAVPLGIARRALEEFTALAARKVRGPAAQSIGHDAAAQVELSRAEGTLAAARSFLFDVIGSVWDTACRGDEPSLDQRALVLLAANQAVRAGAEAVDRVFRLAGADAVFASHPLQRCFRDIHAAGQHILFSGSRDQAFARVRLGLDQPTYLI